jgi:response regulator RpfG family c-di-GMP phosphodiesterase
MSAVTAKLPTVLCVDDERRIVEGIAVMLRREFEVLTASSGPEALQVLSQRADTAVVITDMKMREMDGATLLAKVREAAPECTRILLTGETGQQTAVAAVNDGQIFRFLTKPCSPDKLLTAVRAAVRQHQLATAEKVLLQETVLGSIRALTDVLAIVNPIAFGRGSRIKRLAMQLAEAAGMPQSWELEAAALLSQIGYVSLPGELVERAINGGRLNPDEALQLGEAPKLTQTLLARIPRLENVAAMLTLATHGKLKMPVATEVEAIAAILMLVLEYDFLTSQHKSAADAVSTLQARYGKKHEKPLMHLSEMCGAVESKPRVREVRLQDVQAGMILMDDVRTDTGILLVSSGYEVSESFVNRMRNFGQKVLDEKVRVHMAPKQDAGAGPG